MKKTLLTVFLFGSFTYLNAQVNAVDSVKHTINQMFKGMLLADSAIVKSCFTQDAIMQTFSRDKDGMVLIKSNSVQDFARQIHQLPKDSADERISFETVQIDGPMASVWTPYNLFFNNRFLHCGVNHFVLARLNGIWKIQYLIDTRRKQPCSK